jgi:hypothetical protein
MPVKAGLTVYMVGLPRFVLKMYPLRQVWLYIFGWFTTICCIDVPFKSGLTLYMVGLPWFVV